MQPARHHAGRAGGAEAGACRRPADRARQNRHRRQRLAIRRRRRGLPGDERRDGGEERSEAHGAVPRLRRGGRRAGRNGHRPHQGGAQAAGPPWLEGGRYRLVGTERGLRQPDALLHGPARARSRKDQRRWRRHLHRSSLWHDGRAAHRPSADRGTAARRQAGRRHHVRRRRHGGCGPVRDIALTPMRKAFVLALAALLLTGCAAVETVKTPVAPAAAYVPPPPPPDPKTQMAELETQLSVLVDEARRKIDPKAKPLALDPELVKIARARAQDMADKDYLAHAAPNGDTSASLLMAADAQCQGLLGENLAAQHYVKQTGVDPKAFAQRFLDTWL